MREINNISSYIVRSSTERKLGMLGYYNKNIKIYTLNFSIQQSISTSSVWITFEKGGCLGYEYGKTP
jgi:hypothetical protein